MAADGRLALGMAQPPEAGGEPPGRGRGADEPRSGIVAATAARPPSAGTKSGGGGGGGRRREAHGITGSWRKRKEMIGGCFFRVRSFLPFFLIFSSACTCHV